MGTLPLMDGGNRPPLSTLPRHPINEAMNTTYGESTTNMVNGSRRRPSSTVGRNKENGNTTTPSWKASLSPEYGSGMRGSADENFPLSTIVSKRSTDDDLTEECNISSEGEEDPDILEITPKCTGEEKTWNLRSKGGLNN